MNSMGSGGGELNFVIGTSAQGMVSQGGQGPLSSPALNKSNQLSNAMEGIFNKTPAQSCSKINESFHVASNLNKEVSGDINVSAIATKHSTAEKSVSGQYGMMMH